MPLREGTLLRTETRLNRQGFNLIAGVDEAGRGPLAGPVVAGAVIIRDFRFKNRIDDSKKLTPARREAAYEEIVSKAYIGVGIVEHDVIDDINIYRASIKAMELAIADLKVRPDYLLVDGRMKLVTGCPIRCIINGDSRSFSIAAASIVAKVTRDRLMQSYHMLYPLYEFCRHKGYGTKAHIAALLKLGPSPIHRLSFKPVKQEC